jgi:hypothetical protein
MFQVYEWHSGTLGPGHISWTIRLVVRGWVLTRDGLLGWFFLVNEFCSLRSFEWGVSALRVLSPAHEQRMFRQEEKYDFFVKDEFTVGMKSLSRGQLNVFFTSF